MTTPTGAAIITYFADKFCTMPQCIIHQVGLGMGTRDFESAPNMIRAMLCDFTCDDNCTVQNNTEKLVELRANIDDMTPELSFVTPLEEAIITSKEKGTTLWISVLDGFAPSEDDIKTLERYSLSLEKAADFEFDRYRCEFYRVGH